MASPRRWEMTAVRRVRGTTGGHGLVVVVGLSGGDGDTWGSQRTRRRFTPAARAMRYGEMCCSSSSPSVERQADSALGGISPCFSSSATIFFFAFDFFHSTERSTTTYESEVAIGLSSDGAKGLNMKNLLALR
ncbi:hypothetical protein GUJ93_ZPchr0006g44293 [Zizania palustris]|uniref:Uncharacterized protein n=1 Tax=Zizania palustris TaxID=103762 RepID=A0A8J5SMY5_ZIZPA|nr:hypothetical protein GUJ93_ZPchr0006g44293 [Zizania palustris]